MRDTANIRTFFALAHLLGSVHPHVFATTAVELLGLGVFAGWLGAVVGIGGGVVIVPALVLAFGFGTRVAVASSLVAVVATSAASGSAYTGSGQTNMRLALVLEIATTIGGLAGGIVAVLIAPKVIDGVFGAVMLLTAVLMLRGRSEEGGEETEVVVAMPLAASGATSPAPGGGLGAAAHGAVDATGSRRAPDAGRAHGGTQRAVAQAAAEEAAALVASGERAGWEERGHLGGAYFDLGHDRLVVYRAVRLWIGWAVSFVAGLLSGLLGVGGGFLKVPAMHLGMKVPIKVAAATSNFMIGVTAVASLFVYFTRGYVLPFVAAPLALGVAAGAYAGAKSSQHFPGRALGRILAVVLVFVAVQMALKALGVVSG